MTHTIARRVIIGILCPMTAPETTATGESWIPSDKDFGSRLAAVRHRMGWNVKEAARECGLPAASWRMWEVDGALPRNIVTISMTIAQRTNCDYLWLVHGPDRGALRRNYYGSTRVLLTAERSPKTPEHPSSFGQPHTRAVRQTRPVVGAPLSQRSRVSV